MPYEILLQHVSIVPCLCVFGISHFGLYYLYSSTKFQIRYSKLLTSVSIQLLLRFYGWKYGTDTKAYQVSIQLLLRFYISSIAAHSSIHCVSIQLLLRFYDCYCNQGFTVFLVSIQLLLRFYMLLMICPVCPLLFQYNSC